MAWQLKAEAYGAAKTAWTHLVSTEARRPQAAILSLGTQSLGQEGRLPLDGPRLGLEGEIMPIRVAILVETAPEQILEVPQ